MKKHGQYIIMITALIFAAGLILDSICAAEEGDMQGWGINDPYNELYDVRKFEYFRAWVVGFKVEPPMPGMSPGTIMIVRDGDQLIDIHLGPTWFVKPKDVGVRKGDRVKIKGCRAEIAGKNVFMASKVKKGDYFEFKVRLTQSGKPFWTLTPQELIGEILPE